MITLSCDIIIDGSVAEWLKAHDSKSCGPFKGLEGSNPFASAIFVVSEKLGFGPAVRILSYVILL